MSIHQQVLDFIDNPDPARFERLALDVFACQFERVPAYRQFCLGRGAVPDRIRSVREIPPVSTAAFKYVELRGGPPQRIFLTSGTTRGREQRGRHFVTHPEHYRASALKHLERMLFPDGCRPWMLTLHPTADLMPESSLSQMISWCIEKFGIGRSTCCATPSRIDPQAACDFLRAAETAAEPVCILGTTAALSTVFEHLNLHDIRFRLAPGSRLMDTGGPKGQARPMQSGEVIAMAREFLAIAPELAINEYGMTELCSQLYDATPFNCPQAAAGANRVKIAPPWLMVVARDPITMRPMAAGEAGLLSFFDLANAGSVSALFTEDLGAVNADGTVRIFGRAIDADPRGCALGIEQFALSDLNTDQPARSKLPAFGSPTLPSAERMVDEAASKLRREAESRLTADRIAAAIAAACARWRERDFAARRATLAAAAAATGQSEALLDASLDALLAGFTPDAMADLARRAAGRRRRLIGLIMPGNVIGAGLHELSQALIGGAAVIIKTASTEPGFFAGFHRTLAAIDADVAARIRVLTWSRADRDATRAIARVCDRIAAFGDDETMAALAAIAGPRLIEFGSRMSGAILADEAVRGPGMQALADGLARDVSLFDQRGCLSLHHVFIGTRSPRDAQSFAQSMARAMAESARRMAPAPPAASEAVAARMARENARWRAIGGAPVALWEGPDMGWTVILDPEADFEPSPLCRTVRISTFAGHDELRRRLLPAAGHLEGFAVADPAGRLDRARQVLGEFGVSYFCRPGFLQSPPPSWPHGGGRFLKLMMADDG